MAALFCISLAYKKTLHTIFIVITIFLGTCLRCKTYLMMSKLILLWVHMSAATVKVLGTLYQLMNLESKLLSRQERAVKGGVKGMTLSPELVTEWIDSFPIATYLCDAMENLYMDQDSSSASQPKQKEEGGKRKASRSGENCR